VASDGKAYVYSSPAELVDGSTVLQTSVSPTLQEPQEQSAGTSSDLSYAERINAESVQTAVQLKRASPRGTFLPVEQWEGVVLDVGDAYFSARLVNRMNARVPDEEGRFAFAQLSSTEDRGLVSPGAIFYFSVGYEDSPSRQRRLSAFLRFRRLPAWTAAELTEVEEETDRLTALFGSHRQEGTGEAGG
jgi:hypothetical protein